MRNIERVKPQDQLPFSQLANRSMSRSPVHILTSQLRRPAAFAVVAVLAALLFLAAGGRRLSGATSGSDVNTAESQSRAQPGQQDQWPRWQGNRTTSVSEQPQTEARESATMHLLPVNGTASLLENPSPVHARLIPGQRSVWPAALEICQPDCTAIATRLNPESATIELASFGNEMPAQQTVRGASNSPARLRPAAVPSPVDVTIPRNDDENTLNRNSVAGIPVVRRIPTAVSFENVFADDSVRAFPTGYTGNRRDSGPQTSVVGKNADQAIALMSSAPMPGNQVARVSNTQEAARSPRSATATSGVPSVSNEDALPSVIVSTFPPTQQAAATPPQRVRDGLRISFPDDTTEASSEPAPSPLPPGPDTTSTVVDGPGTDPPAFAAPNEASVSIPFSGVDPVSTDDQLRIAVHDGLVTIFAREVSLGLILTTLATDHGINIVSGEAISDPVSVTLTDVPLDDALNAILTVHGMTWTRRNEIIVVSRVNSDQAMSAMAQGRVVRVFELSFARASDIQPVVESLLSPVGQVQVTMPGEITGAGGASNISASAGGALGGGMQNLQARRTRDRLIVEDLPDYIERVASCVEQIDVPPRQVLIEAHILEVDLTQSIRHGIDLESLSHLGGTSISVQSGNGGFGSLATSPSLVVGIDSKGMDGLLDALKRTLSARTLAAPRVLVTHGHRAEIQVGGQIGFLQSTTTQTSTIQGVEFLDVGVILTVTPYISSDGRIQLQVHPEVSSGQLNEKTQLPESERAHVETSILLRDGQGMVIGGLIRETDRDARAKTPLLGETWMIGRLFQHLDNERVRSEVIIALIPRIVDCECGPTGREDIDYERATTPLLDPALRQIYRPWEPQHPEVLYRPCDVRENYRTFRESDGTRLIDSQYVLPQRPGFSFSSEYMEQQPLESPGQPAYEVLSPRIGDVRAESGRGIDPARFKAPVSRSSVITRPPGPTRTSGRTTPSQDSTGHTRPASARPGTVAAKQVSGNRESPPPDLRVPANQSGVPRAAAPRARRHNARQPSSSGGMLQRLREKLPISRN